jgi:hypothetical protein
MITGNYVLTPTVEWKNVQFEDIFLVCDTTLSDVNIALPALSALGGFWSNRIHILNKVGGNKVNIIAFNNTPPVPPTPLVVNFINGVASITLENTGDSCVVTVEDENNWVSALAGTSGAVPTIVPALDQAGLSGATYDALPIGSTLAVVDYNATGDGCTLVKTTTANNDSTDWVIVATDLVASTGGIGTNPI